MAITANLQISTNSSGGPLGTVATPTLTTTAANALGLVQSYTLNSGNNTITVPSGVTFAVITGPNAVVPIPNPQYAGTLTLKGVNGDTGIPVSARYPTVLEWDTVTVAPASIVVNASVATTIYIEWQ